MRRQMSDYQRGVGQRLKDLRISKQASQEAAARIADVSTTTWRNWERGLRAPYERNWQKIKDGFELADDDIGELRGTPPTPLGLERDESGEVLVLLRRQNELLENVAEALATLTQLALEGLPSEAPQPTARPSRARQAAGS